MKVNHLFWKLVHHLIVKENARILEVSPDKKKIWMEHEHNKIKSAIRLARVEYDWMRDIQADMVEAKRSFAHVKRLIPRRHLVCHNIYVSTYPPVDLSEPLSSYEDKESNMSHSFVEEDQLHPVTDHPQDVLNKIGSKHKWEDVEVSLTNEEHETFAAYFRREALRKQESLEKKDRSLLLFGKPRLTYVLLAAIFTMYFLVERAGGSTNILTLIHYGAKYNPAIIEGEWWRLFSSMFLHIGFLHLFMNSLALFYLGTAVERMYGSFRFLFIYFSAGLFGSLASFALNEQISAGASGAIFGCFGALIYFGLIHRKLFFRTMGFNVIIILAINLSFGFIVPAVDNGAHIGGLIGGFLASAAVHLPRHKSRMRQVVMIILVLLLATAVYNFGLSNDHKKSAPLVDIQIAQNYLQENNVEEAEEILRHLLEEEDNTQARFLLGNVFVQQNNMQEAKEQFTKAISLHDEFPEAYYNLTIVNLQLGNREEAEKAFEQLKAMPSSSKEHLEIDKLESLFKEKTND